jgi:hypothetical protein
MTRVHLLAIAASAVLLAAGCAPTSGTGGAPADDAFAWYADACVTAADAARSTYSSADGPVSRVLAEKSLDALELAASRALESLPPDTAAYGELARALKQLQSRTPLTEVSPEEKAKFERNKAVVDAAIVEIGEMCRSVFAGFDTTQSPSP